MLRRSERIAVPDKLPGSASYERLAFNDEARAVDQTLYFRLGPRGAFDYGV